MSPTKQDFISIESSQHEDQENDDEVDDMIELKFINNETHGQQDHHQIVQLATESIESNHIHDQDQQYRKLYIIKLCRVFFLYYIKFSR